MKFMSCAFLLCLVLSACGKGGGSSSQHHDDASPEDLKKLSSVELSFPVTATADKECNPDKAVSVFTTAPSYAGDAMQKALAVVNHCGALLACSDSAKSFIENTGGKATILIGVTDFKLAGLSKLREGSSANRRGLYDPNKKGIYLDSTMDTWYETCHVFLHELTHRFDAGAQKGPTFNSEFKAYYAQTLFSAELDESTRAKSTPEMQRVARPHVKVGSAETPGFAHFITRDELAEEVVTLTGMSEDPAFVASMPEYPWEHSVKPGEVKNQTN